MGNGYPTMDRVSCKQNFHRNSHSNDRGVRAQLGCDGVSEAEGRRMNRVSCMDSSSRGKRADTSLAGSA